MTEHSDVGARIIQSKLNFAGIQPRYQPGTLNQHLDKYRDHSIDLLCNSVISIANDYDTQRIIYDDKFNIFNPYEAKKLFLNLPDRERLDVTGRELGISLLTAPLQTPVKASKLLLGGIRVVSRR